MSDSPPSANYDPRTDGDLILKSGPSVRPRHAATLILVRRDRAEPSLLMGRRAGGHAFMPNKWVFPGGRVDRADFTAPAANALVPAVNQALSVMPRHPNPSSLAKALGMAAIRETFEEAGLMLARPGQTAKARGGWGPFLAQGALADLSALRFIARAITPPYRPRRFDARFFMAEAEALQSQERLPDCGELDDIAWVPLSDVRALDLPNITRFVVDEITERLASPGVERPIPFVRYRATTRELAVL